MTTITKAGRAVRLIPARRSVPPGPQRHGARWEAQTFDLATAGKPLSRSREAARLYLVVGLSQADAAAQAGCSRQALNAYCRTIRRPHTCPACGQPFPHQAQKTRVNDST